MADLLEDVDLSSDALNIGHVGNAAFLQHLHCHFFTCERVDAQLHLAESALTEVTSHHVVANGASALQGRL
jgi:hypothetical protein